MTYTLYWVGKDSKDKSVTDDYTVMVEDWPSVTASDPIPDTLRVVSGNHTEAEAEQIVKAKQHASYSENRRSNGNP